MNFGLQSLLSGLTQAVLLQNSVCRSFPLQTGCVAELFVDTLAGMNLDFRMDLTLYYLFFFHICVTLKAPNFGVPQKNMQHR